LRAFQRYVTRHLHARKLNDSQLLVVGGQIANLTPNLSFCYNLCVKCPNGSGKPILDIYVPRVFQWYKKLCNPMGFDPFNCFMKIWESIRTPILKVGVHLGVWGFIPSHSLTLLGPWDVILGIPSWPAPLQALCLSCEPKVRVATPCHFQKNYQNGLGLKILTWVSTWCTKSLKFFINFVNAMDFWTKNSWTMLWSID
jgi:hypothetical protein